MNQDTAARTAFPILMRTCTLLMGHLDRELQGRVGIQLIWYQVLDQLHASGTGRLPMKQLAETVMLSRSGISRLVDRMERAGMVQRHSCTDDGRVCFAALTRRGHTVLQVSRPVAAEVVDRHFARHVAEHEAEVLKAALLRVLDGAAPRRPEWERSPA